MRYRAQGQRREATGELPGRRRACCPTRGALPAWLRPAGAVARAARPRRGTARAVRLRGFRPGQREAVRGRPGRPRRAGGHAHGLGQVALLPAAGAAARRPDRRRVAARGADAGPGGGARARAALGTASRWSTPSRTGDEPAALDAGGRGRAAPALRGAGALRRARVPGADAARRGSACSWSTRRTASPSGGTTSGPTTSAWPTPRAALGARALVASTATATPRVAADVEKRLGLRDPLRVATGFDRPNISFTVARPAAHEKRAADRGGAARADALPAIVYAGTRAGAEELAARADPRARRGGGAPTTRDSTATAGRRSSAASWPTRCA